MTVMELVIPVLEREVVYIYH